MFRFSISNRAVFQLLTSSSYMSSEEDEAQSPITGASGSKSQVSPMRSPDDSDENAEFEEEDETPLKRGHKKDTREWMQICPIRSEGF